MQVPLSGRHEVVVERVGVRGTAERSSSGTSPHPSPLPKGEGTSTSTSPHPNPLPEERDSRHHRRLQQGPEAQRGRAGH